MCQEGKIGNFNYEQQKDGTFLYKSSNPSSPIPTIKLKDKPQYKVIDQMETEMKKSGRKMIENIGINIIKFLKKQ